MLSNSKEGTTKPEELCKGLKRCKPCVAKQPLYPDFDNTCVIDKGNYRVRKTLESWHTAKTVDAENNSKPLPRQYSILL